MKDEYEISFDVSDRRTCVYLFGEKHGGELWETLQNPIKNPRHSIYIQNVDLPKDTIYISPVPK